MKNKLLAFLIPIVILAAGTGAYYFSTKNQAVDSSVLKVYKGSKYAFNFSYPGDLILKEPYPKGDDEAERKTAGKLIQLGDTVKRLELGFDVIENSKYYSVCDALEGEFVSLSGKYLTKETINDRLFYKKTEPGASSLGSGFTVTYVTKVKGTCFRFYESSYKETGNNPIEPRSLDFTDFANDFNMLTQIIKSLVI